jgi:hypothetical protein
LDGISLVSLQTGPAQSAIADYFDRAPLLNLGAEIADFADTMAIIETLDLIVTVDTAVAHLAGAMGKPVWILLPYAPDWRWLLERSDSPWYPSARLFRQPSPGDWASVVRRVGEALSEPRFEPQRHEKPCNQVSPGAPLYQGGRSAPDRSSRAKRRMRSNTEISGGLCR